MTLPSSKSPGTAPTAGLILSAIILLVWLVVLAWLTSLGDSDAAGNGMTQGFAALGIVLLWLLLAILVFVGALAGTTPPWAALAGLMLIPGSGYAAFVALDLLSEPGRPPFFWPIAEPALVPPLIVITGLWTLVPSLRRAVPGRIAAGAGWGAVLLLSVALVPLVWQREADTAHVRAAAAKLHADFAALKADARLWDLTPFLAPNSPYADDVLRRVQQMDRRQNDAEIMLARGDFPLRYLPYMALQATPAICDQARAELRQRVTPLILATPRSRPYVDIFWEVEAAASAMEWLAQQRCPIVAEAGAWAGMATAYRDPNFDLVRLQELRDGVR